MTSITRWLVVATVTASALVLCTWIIVNSRRERQRLYQHIESLTQQVELQQRSLDRVVAHRDSMMDPLGTVMLVATSHAATITSDRERREALDSIARAARETVETCRGQSPVLHR